MNDTAGIDAPPAGAAKRIVICYKRDAEDDVHLMRVLEQNLTARGYQVFVDRHIPVGDDWGQVIETRIRASDAVVPLLSRAAVASEMVTCEVELAHQASVDQNGRPRILPVRIRYEDEKLPYAFQAALGRLQYSAWTGPSDDDKVANEIVCALEGRPAPSDVSKKAVLPFEPIGGAVPIGSPYYVERPIDREFLAAVEARHTIVLVKGGRQMGKTSVLARGLEHGRKTGAKVAFTDFQTLNAEHLTSADALLKALAIMLMVELDLGETQPFVWDEQLGASMRMHRFMKRVLETLKEPLVWGLDEVDRLFPYPFAGEVFGLIRSWHNRRSMEPSGPWSRLTLAMAYATEANLFITDLHQSPFNVGTRLSASDFTIDQVSRLNEDYGEPLRSPTEVAALYDLLGGHPYLVRQALDQLAAHGLAFDVLKATAISDDGPFGDHLHRLMVSLTRDPSVTTAVRQLLAVGTPPTEELFYRLRSAGVIVGETPTASRLRCRLYDAYIRTRLLG